MTNADAETAAVAALELVEEEGEGQMTVTGKKAPEPQAADDASEGAAGLRLRVKSAEDDKGEDDDDDGIGGAVQPTPKCAGEWLTFGCSWSCDGGKSSHLLSTRHN